jgi:hypothetical protein
VSRLLAGLLFLAILVMLPSSPAMADHCGAGVSDEVCAEAQGAGFDVGTGGKAPAVVPAAGGPGSGRPAPVLIQQRTHVPTCTGNTAQDNGILCTAALESCPVEGEIQFWVFVRDYNTVTGATTGWSRVTSPSTVCLGPEDPVIDPAVAIPAIVQRDFKRVVVVKGVAEVSPRPDTLVNIPTVFTTSTPASYDIPLSLLGQSVVITATAERYTWHFGDGNSATTSAPDGRVEHEYRKAAVRQAYVVIEWSGTFRINGGASQTINGRATTTGDPIAVDVKQARTELVRD